jgi:hypothetical protein
VRHPRWKATGGTIESVTMEQALALASEAKTEWIEFVVTDDKVYGFASQASQKLKAWLRARL